jgi:hypothetical protein
VFRVFGEWSGSSVEIESARSPVGAAKGD